MVAAVDASSPARATGATTNGTTTITTAAFNPPAALLVATCQANARNATGGTGNGTGAITNNGAALTWTTVGERNQSDSGQMGYAGIFVAPLTASRTGMTVTLTMTGTGGFPNNINTPTIKLYVVTGADLATMFGGTAEGSSTTNNLTTTGFTVLADGSLGFVSGCEWQATGPGITSTDCTVDVGGAAGTSISYASGFKTLGAAGSSATFNLDAQGTGVVAWNWVSVEIKAAATPAMPTRLRGRNTWPGSGPNRERLAAGRFTRMRRGQLAVRPKINSFKDDFAFQDNSKWQGWGANVAIVSGALQLTTTSAYPGTESLAAYDLRDSILSIEIVQTPNLGNGSTSMQMQAVVDANNSAAILWEGGTLYGRYTVNGVASVVGIPYNATAHRIWRIRESGGTLYFEASSSGAAWTNIRSPVATPINVSAVTVIPNSGYWGTEPTPGSAIFDNLNATYADPPPFPRTFYVDTAGSDSNDGLSTGAAWATVSKVSNSVLYPGDVILFNRGQQWTGNLVIASSGTAGAPITFDAYGTGDIPTITGGGSSGTAGTLKSLEVFGSYVDIINMEFNGSIDRNMYFNGADCSVIGCAIRWGSVGIEQGAQAARLRIQYNTFIDVNVGIIQAGPNDDYGANCIILDGDAAEVSYNVASGAWFVSPDYGFDGSFCDIYGGTNAVIHHNFARETVAIGEVGNPVSNNNTFHHNVFVSSISIATGYVIHGAFYDDGTTPNPFGPVTNTHIHHNTTVLTGASAAGIWVSPGGEIDLQNNIFVVASTATMAVVYDSTRTITEMGNTYWGTTAGNVNMTMPGGGGVAGIDPTSVVADPKFISPAEFRLQAGSPALDRGADLGYVIDFSGNPRISGAAPDSGAYEGAWSALFIGWGWGVNVDG